MRNYLKNLSCHFKGDYKKIAQGLKQRIQVVEYPIEMDFLCFGEKQYPQAFYDMINPPWVIYYRGDLSLLEKPCLAMVGSRTPSDYGKAMALSLSQNLSQRFVIVSGLAKGIDGLCHFGAIRQGRTIGILGCGLDVYYPKENRELIDKLAKEHLICSEYPPQTPPLAHHFPIRNRLIVGLAKSLVVVEANHRSGSTSSVTQALTLGKDVYCVPFRYDEPTGQANNHLISLGAQILTKENIQDIV